MQTYLHTEYFSTLRSVKFTMITEQLAGLVKDFLSSRLLGQKTITSSSL